MTIFHSILRNKTWKIATKRHQYRPRCSGMLWRIFARCYVIFLLNKDQSYSALVNVITWVHFYAHKWYNIALHLVHELQHLMILHQVLRSALASI